MANQPYKPKSAWSGKPITGVDNRNPRKKKQDAFETFITGTLVRRMEALPLADRPAHTGLPASAAPLNALPRWLAEQLMQYRGGSNA